MGLSGGYNWSEKWVEGPDEELGIFKDLYHDRDFIFLFIYTLDIISIFYFIYLYILYFYLCLPQLPAITHISFPSSSPAGHQKKDF